MNPVKRGDMVAFEESHSYTSRGEGTVRYSTFHLGEIDRASKEGVARVIRPNTGSYVPLKVQSGVTVYTLSDGMQAAARSLFEKSSYPGLSWDSASDLKAALLAVQS